MAIRIANELAVRFQKPHSVSVNMTQQPAGFHPLS